MSRRIAFINEKGGTGKTTLAVNVAAYLAEKRKQRVLLVDLDTQGHAGKCLGVDVRTVSPNVFHFLTDPSVTLDEVLSPTSSANLFVLPSYKQMADFPLAVAQTPRREFLLRDKLAAVEGRFDVILFDSPPSLGLTTHNILAAANEVVVPVALSYLALDGCAEMVSTVERVARELAHPQLHISRVVPTMYRKTALADEILEKLRGYFPEKCSEPLPMNVKIDEAQSHAQTIWEYSPWSRGAALLQKAAEEIFNVP